MKILLPIDGSEVSLEAVRHAIALRREGLRAEFVLANVQEPATLYEMVRAPDPQMLDEIRVAAGSHVLQSAEVLLREAGMEATEDDVIDFLNEHGVKTGKITKWMLPKLVAITSDIPKTSVGKYNKKAVRDDLDRFLAIAKDTSQQQPA